MTTFELGDSKQVIIANGRLQLWANRGSLGVELTPEQMEAIGLALFTRGRRMKRENQCRSGACS